MTRFPFIVMPLAAVLLVAGVSCSTDQTTSSSAAGGSESAPETDPPSAESGGMVDESLTADPSPPRPEGEMIQALEAAVQRNPSLPRLLALADAYGGAWRLDEAEALYKRILASMPNHPVALHHFGTVALLKGDKDRAIALHQRAIAAKPDYMEAHFELAELLKWKGRYGEAYAGFQAVLRIQPATREQALSQLDARYQMATIDLAAGDYPRAEQVLARLLAAAPTHRMAHYAQAQALLHMGRQEEAARELELHMQLLASTHPTSPVATGR